MSILEQIRVCVTRFRVDQNKIPGELHIGRAKLYNLRAELRGRHTEHRVLIDVLTPTERRQIYGPVPISIFGMKVILCTDDSNHLSVRSSTHTPQPQEKPTMKPFDLEAAKRGEPIVTRDGRKAKFIAHVPEAPDGHKAIAFIEDGLPETFSSEGIFHIASGKTSLDLLMAPPPMRSINGHEYPEPVRQPLEVGREYWIVDIYAKLSVVSMTWAGEVPDMRWLKRGLIHLTREAAEAHARAIILAGGGEV